MGRGMLYVSPGPWAHPGARAFWLGGPRLHYRLLTLCLAPTDPVGQSWPRGTGSVGDSVGEGVSVVAVV